MSRREDIYGRLWGELQSQQPPTKRTCVYAAQYRQFTDELCTSVAEIIKHSPKEGIPAINQAYVRVFIRFFEWHAAVPKAHRSRSSDKSHTCLFSVLESAFYALRAMELMLSPPMLFLPVPPPPPPPPPRIAGIGLGILEEE